MAGSVSFMVQLPPIQAPDYWMNYTMAGHKKQQENLFCPGSAFCQGVFYLYSKKNYEVIDWQQDTEDAKRNSQVSIL